MSKKKLQLQKGNMPKGGKKLLKSKEVTAKKKSKLRKKIFVKGGLRDGQVEILPKTPGAEEQAVNSKPVPLKGTIKKLSEAADKEKKFKKHKRLSAKIDSKDSGKAFIKKKQETDAQSSGKTPTHTQKNSHSKAKKLKKKVNGKKKESGVVLPVEVKRAVTNIKASKEKVSSNWEAFKEIGLHKNEEKPRGNSKFEGVFRKKRKALQGQDDSIPTNVKTDENITNSIDCLDLEDSYIKDLIPPEGDSLKKLTKCIAIDCEMVGVGDGKESALARVSLVNQHGACVYDKFVKPKEDVVDYRTKVSGVRPADLALGEELEVVQKEVADIVQGRILVGHALRHDLKVLFLTHPFNMTRDTSKFKPFKVMFNGQTPSLKNLSSKILGVNIQDGEHSSVEDAKATMQLYNLYSKEWEEQRRVWALRKREKMLRLKQEKNSGTSENAETHEGALKTTSSKPKSSDLPIRRMKDDEHDE